MSAPASPSNVSALIPTLARRIIEMIRREGYPVGHRLTEQALCDELDVSRSPVRKALQYLQATGAVSSEPNRGFQVAKMPSELGELEFAPNPASEEVMYMRIANDRINGLIPDEIAENDLMERYGLARLPNFERFWLGFASVLVISPSRTATLVGLAMGVPVLLRQLSAWRAAQSVVRAQS